MDRLDKQRPLIYARRVDFSRGWEEWLIYFTDTVWVEGLVGLQGLSDLDTDEAVAEALVLHHGNGFDGYTPDIEVRLFCRWSGPRPITDEDRQLAEEIGREFAQIAGLVGHGDSAEMGQRHVHVELRLVNWQGGTTLCFGAGSTDEATHDNDQDFPWED